MSDELNVQLSAGNTYLISNDTEFKKTTLTCKVTGFKDPNDEEYSKTYKATIMSVNFDDDGKPYLWYGRDKITSTTEATLGEYTTSILEDNERVLVCKSTGKNGNTISSSWYYAEALDHNIDPTISFDYKVKHLATLLDTELDDEKAKYFENTAPLYIVYTRYDGSSTNQGFVLKKNEDGTYYICLLGYFCSKGTGNPKRYRVRSNDLNIDFTQWQHIDIKSRAGYNGLSLYINGEIVSFYLDNPDDYYIGTIESETPKYLVSPTIIKTYSYWYIYCFEMRHLVNSIYYGTNFNSAVPMYKNENGKERATFVDRGEEIWYKNFKMIRDINKTTVTPYPSITYTWLKGNELSTDVLKTSTYTECTETDTLEVSTDDMNEKQQQFTCVVTQENLSGFGSIMLWKTKKLNPKNRNANKKIIKVSGVLKDSNNNPLPLHYLLVHSDNKSWVSMLTNYKGEYEFYLSNGNYRVYIQNNDNSEILYKGNGEVNEKSKDCTIEEFITEEWYVA